MDFKLPEIGEGVVEGELVRWLVKVGDPVAVDQPLLEVMTDKATVEVPSNVAGTVKALKAKDGEMIKVGAVLAEIEGGAATQTAAAKPVTPPPPPSSSFASPPPVPSVQKTIVPEFVVKTPRPSESHSNGNGSHAYVGAVEALNPSNVPAAPVVREMARHAGVRLEDVPASGPDVGGKKRVLESDLLRFLEAKGSVSSASYAAPAAPATPAYYPPARDYSSSPMETERKPLRGLRRVIAQAMTKSKYTAPHYSYVDEFECSQLVEFREQAKIYGEKLGVKITYLPFVVKAVVAALKEFPIVNSSLEETPNGQEIVYKNYFNIGFAVATGEGLLVPVIKHADKKSIVEIAREMTDLSNKVRAGKASPDELKGSTFSITSMGNIGGLFATPIINYPEVGILGVYKVQEKPIVKNSQIVVGKTMHLSLSLDHRVVDGAVGGAFCNAIIERLANPARLLMELI